MRSPIDDRPLDLSLNPFVHQRQIRTTLPKTGQGVVKFYILASRIVKEIQNFHTSSGLIVQKDLYQTVMSNNYEMMYILRPDLSEEQVQEVSSKYKTMLQESGASDLQIQVRGKRHLAYPIQNFNDGIYIQVNYKADGSQIKAIERDMRLGETVIRYLTMKLDAEPVALEADAPPSEPAAPGA